MSNFEFENHTRIIFGRGVEHRLAELAKEFARTNTVMLVSYAGNPLKALIETLKSELHAAGFQTTEYYDVVPNPTLDKVEAGILQAREANAGLMVGVGGGSCIDTAKAIAVGRYFEDDLWKLYTGEAEPNEILPVGAISTLAGTGSETSIFAVVTNTALQSKIGYGHPQMQPKFALLNPELSYSVSPYQTACGACDMFAHILDCYLSRTEDMPVTYALSESVVRSVAEFAPVAIRNPDDYEARSQLMLCGTLAMGKFASMGLNVNLGLHTLAEDIGAVYNVTHGAALSALIPAWMTFLRKEKQALLVRFAAEVWHIAPDAGNLNKTVDQAIARTKEFLKSLGLPVSLAELGIDFEKEGKKLAERINYHDDFGIEYVQLTPEQAYQIYEYAAR